MKKFNMPLIVLCGLLVSPLSVADYLQTIPQFWRNLYPNGGKSLYCADRFAKFDRNYNIEHVFPMSWVARHLKCGSRQQCRRNSALFNQIEADMHNMYPARRSINKARGSMMYGMVAGERPADPGCDLEIDTRKRRVEPRPAVRGDIARAMLYIQQRYGVPIYTKQRKRLLQWHKQDPADGFEHWRNLQIERLQGKPNPWINKPSP